MGEFLWTNKNKDRIMQVATDLFQEKGPKFTMDELASALKMSKKTLYVYFTDKEDLFHHAVDHIFDSITDAKSKIITDETIELRRESSKRCRCCQGSINILISGSCIC